MNKAKQTDNLTYERAIEILRYEPETGVLERKLKNGEWRVCGDKPDCHRYGTVKVNRKMYKTHRLIWLLVHSYMPEFIDHLDRDRMNNKINNLRVAAHIENSHNLGMYRNNTSGYPGVSFHKATNKYLASIGVNGKRIHIGLFNTAEEAFVAYMVAKIRYHPTSPAAQEYLRELTLAG